MNTADKTTQQPAPGQGALQLLAEQSMIAAPRRQLMSTQPELLTVKNAAKKLGQDFQTTYRWIRRGWLEALPWGPRGVRISSDTIERILRNGVRTAPITKLKAIGRARIASRSRDRRGKAWAK